MIDFQQPSGYAIGTFHIGDGNDGTLLVDCASGIATISEWQLDFQPRPDGKWMQWRGRWETDPAIDGLIVAIPESRAVLCRSPFSPAF